MEITICHVEWQINNNLIALTRIWVEIQPFLNKRLKIPPPPRFEPSTLSPYRAHRERSNHRSTTLPNLGLLLDSCRWADFEQVFWFWIPVVEF